MHTAATAARWRRRRLAGGIVGGGLAAYLAALLFMVVCEEWLVFGPAGAGEWRDRPAVDVEDVKLTGVDGTPLHAWWWPAPAARPVLLFLHGNGGNITTYADMMLRLRHALGLPILIVDYPGYGKSGGSPSEQGCYAAADAAYDWLVAQGVAPQDIVLFGDSLGGGVAVELASRRDHRALVLVKTFTSLPDVASRIYPVAPVHWLMRTRFESIGRIGRCVRPVLIAHGTEDALIPHAQGEQLFRAAAEPKSFVSIPGGRHTNDLPDAFLAALKAFLETPPPD
jgi:uncharacterized protein